MELSKLSRQLKLMELLAGNVSLDNAEIAARLGISVRSVYRYLEAFREMGFVVEREGDIYRLDKSSPFFRHIAGGVLFTDDEAEAMARILAGVSDNSVQVKSLRRKLTRLYDHGVMQGHEADRRLAENISLLYEAVRQRLTVVLKDYRSLHGSSVSNRVVEPCRFLNANDDIRCYEPASGEYKTFKVARIGQVCLLELKQSHAQGRDEMLTDIFGFTGTAIDEITLRLSPRAAALIAEELPDSHRFTAANADGSATLKAEVCSYLGPARFVFGLWGDVEVAGSTAFRQFLSHEAENLTQKFRF